MPPTPRIGACGRPLGSCAFTCIHLVSMGSTASHSVGRAGFAPQEGSFNPGHRAGFAPQEGSFNPGVPRVKRFLLWCKPWLSLALGCKPSALGDQVCTPGAPGLHPRAGESQCPRGRVGKGLPFRFRLRHGRFRYRCGQVHVDVEIDRNRDRTSLTRRRVGGFSYDTKNMVSTSYDLRTVLESFVSEIIMSGQTIPSPSK